MQHEKRSRRDKTATKQQQCLVHDSVNHPRLRSSSLTEGCRGGHTLGARQVL
jgi:hypothetical protein